MIFGKTKEVKYQTMQNFDIPPFEVKKMNEIDERGAILTILEELRSLKDKFEKSDEANKRIIKKLTEEVMALRSEVRKLRDAGTEADISLLPNLPFVSLEDFKEFDTMLLAEDEMRAQLKIIIKRVGGRDYSSFLRLAIRTIISEELAALLSWRGTSDKPSIQVFTCLKLIKDACHSKYSSATDVDINKICQQHFLHAKDRLIKRRKITTQET